MGFASSRLHAVTAVQNPSRVDAVRSTGLLDSPREEAFDRLTRLASTVLNAPRASLSLVDADRQFIKSWVGLPELVDASRSIPLDRSFCQHAVASGEPLIIADVRNHRVVRDNPALGELGVVAYAGIPLLTDEGHAVGTLCVHDTVPRAWTVQEVSALRDLAAIAMAEIGLRQELADRERAGVEREELGRALRMERDRFDSLFAARIAASG